MSLFDDTLAAARTAVRATYARAMVVTAMTAGEYRAATPDPTREPLAIEGVLHEHVITRRGGEEAIVERSDGGRPGGRFGIDLAGAPTRISFDLDALAGWIPPAGTIVALDDSSRRFEVTHAAPPNGGRIFLYVTEIAA